MDIKKFANKLNGRQYGREITNEEIKLAKELGYVIVFGYSDDCTEFRGFIEDEISTYKSRKIYLNKSGIINKPNNDKNSIKIIEAIWCGEENYAWTYKTDIPHVNFNIFEDNKKYCRGIIFNIKEF